ncbi:MAG: DUF3179 domain-containing protein [Gammaproteobacteria bacterium]|nr:DUF3179 domain-containing protein [Gammaproteobacteria bacterium]MDH3414932.1 DUF3179 domain-containing protein [Gammaproteobacteria bacterium]
MNKKSLPGKSFVAAILMSLVVTACGGGGSGNKNREPAPLPDIGEWLLPLDRIADGGPGRDGIPALQNPEFESAATVSLRLTNLAVAIRHNGAVKIYPHDILNWHEIVNDGPADDPYSLSYCPLTGSALAWKGLMSHADPSFGVSGLLYDSNLLLFDRETSSVWSQMFGISVSGPRIREIPQAMQVLEGYYGTLRGMYPDAMVMTRNTGYIRDYIEYPYRDYRTSADLLFLVSNIDNRMHPKTRVIGFRSGTGIEANAVSKVYQLGAFGPTLQAINDQVDGQDIVVVGSTDLNFAVIYSRELADGTILAFSPVIDDLPNIMSDDEGNVWDSFGTAVSGPRAGEQLAMTNSYVAYWFAWATHFPDAQIHFNDL